MRMPNRHYGNHMVVPQKKLKIELPYYPGMPMAI
jgi:hypothetical protein